MTVDDAQYSASSYRKTDLQPETNRSPDHVTADKIVTWLNDEQYWLYAVVDPDSNELLNTMFESVRTKDFVGRFMIRLLEKIRLDNTVFFIGGDHLLNYAYDRQNLEFRYE